MIHWFVHARLVRYLNEVFPEAVIVGRGSFPLGDRNEPQPDIAILAPGAYDNRAAEPAEILAMIEIADSSLANDLGVKAELYARYDIPDYVVSDINGAVVVHHSSPDGGAYTSVRRYARGTAFRLLSAPDVALDTARFLGDA